MRSLYYVRLDISFLSTSDGVKGVYTHAYKMNLIYVIYHVTAYFVDEKYGFLCCQSVTS